MSAAIVFSPGAIIKMIQNTLFCQNICPIRGKTLQKSSSRSAQIYETQDIQERKAEAKDIFNHRNIRSCLANFFLKFP